MANFVNRLLFFLLLSCANLAGFTQTPFDQHAQWITTAAPTADSACPVFIKRVQVSKGMRSAKLWITAQGLYNARINGLAATRAYLTPGFTSYQHRLLYQQYDVTKLLRQGMNDLQITLAGGWYRGVFGGDMMADRYGRETALLALVQLEYADGRREWVGTDTSWRAGEGPIRCSNIYHGEYIDHRISPHADQAVAPGSLPRGRLELSTAEPVEEQETFNPQSVNESDGGALFDFGQNLAGKVRLRVKGKPGDTVTVEHAEMLDKAGRFYTGNLREARATDVYILKGNGWEEFEPSFTYHGFRYARVRGLDIEHIKATAVAVHNKLRHAGSFACSNPLINRLQHNIEWSLNSNFVSIPSDCPQRSERLGWTGDAQVFVATAAFNRDVRSFFASWLRDLAAAQGTTGGVPAIIPDIYRLKDTIKGGVAGWGDAATVIPWTLYECYADTTVLRQQYPSMKAWVNYIRSKSPDGLWGANGYGDWYAQGDSTSLPFIDQCYYARSTELLARAAGVLGNTSDSLRYMQLLDTVKIRFIETYGAFNTKATQTQTAFALALAFNMLPATGRPAIAARLASAIRDNGEHLATGFLGTPVLLPVLSRFGYDSLAYHVLLQTTCPSWLYPVTRGATTIWEKWDAISPRDSLQATSFNHYAYGAVGDWLYRYLAGIAPDPSAPGYRKIIIAPHPGGQLTWCKASYGEVKVSWKHKNGRFILDVSVPPNTTGTVYLPADPHTPIAIGAGKHRFTQND